MSEWPATARKLSYRYATPLQTAFTTPAVEVTVIYDPAAFLEEGHLEWALHTALHQLRQALATELKGDTYAHDDQESSG